MAVGVHACRAVSERVAAWPCGRARAWLRVFSHLGAWGGIGPVVLVKDNVHDCLQLYQLLRTQCHCH